MYCSLFNFFLCLSILSIENVSIILFFYSYHWVLIIKEILNKIVSDWLFYYIQINDS